MRGVCAVAIMLTASMARAVEVTPAEIANRRCFSCHGQVNQMPVMYHAKPHSMAWCLECHRHPENFLRPDDQIFNLDWKPDDVKPADFVAKYGQPKDATEDFSKKKKLTQTEIGQTLKEKWNIKAPVNCQGCHR